MERLFSPTILENFIEGLKKEQGEITYIGDLSDFGNEVGIILGKVYPNMTEQEMNEFIIGLRHGITFSS